MSIDLEKAKKIMGAVGTLGSGTVLKAIGKFVPGIGQFVSGAYTAGYAADQILDFVKDKLESPSAKRNRQQLQSRAEQGIARPDENAALSQIEQQRSPLDTAGRIAKLGAQAAGGIASARAGAEQQAQEQALQQQQLQMQQDAEMQRQDEHRQNLQLKQRQINQQNLNSQQKQVQKEQSETLARQQQELRRKEDLEFKKRAEERAIEKHKLDLNKSSLKKAGSKEIPKDYASALTEVLELINGAP